MPFDQLLKRHFWAVIVVLVVVAAFLDAQGIMHLVGARLEPDDTPLAVPPLSARAPTGQPSPTPHATGAGPILDRNPFDSVTGPLNLPPPTIASAQEVVDSMTPLPGPNLNDPFGAPPCDGVQVLIITASADPEWSFAAMTTTADKGKSFLRRRGSEIGGKTVLFVGWDRVWLTSATQLCQAQMFKPPAPPTPSAAPSAAAAPPSPNAVSDDIKNGIKKVGPNEFNVDRSVVDKILENQADLMRQARIVPEQENGKVVGIRLFGIKSDTLLGTLGMQNGDRLEKINGFEMASPETALEAYARLRTADHLTVSINRNGQPTNIDFNIK
jgi:general secretion pathway protein C